jgi:hypothetical protein
MAKNTAINSGTNGDLSPESSPSFIDVNAARTIGTAQTGTTYTLAITDKNDYLHVGNDAGVALTIPPNSSVAFPVGAEVEGRNTSSTGEITITPGSGVTLNGNLTVPKDGYFSLKKVSADGWDVAVSAGQASSTSDGYLSSTDWSTFDNKQDVYKSVAVVNTAAYTVLISDDVIAVDYTITGAVAIALPSASASFIGSSGKRFLVKDSGANAGTNNITINRSGTDTIIDTTAGQTSTVITTDGGAVWVHAKNDSTWIIY